MISHYVIDFGNVTYMSNITRCRNITPINNIAKTTLANCVTLRILVCACTDKEANIYKLLIYKKKQSTAKPYAYFMGCTTEDLDPLTFMFAWLPWHLAITWHISQLKKTWFSVHTGSFAIYQACDLELAWWLHDMEMFFTLLAFCEAKPLVTGGFPSQWASNVQLLCLLCC